MTTTCDLKNSSFICIISPENNIGQGNSDNFIETLVEMECSDSLIMLSEDDTDQGKSDSCMTTTVKSKDSDTCIITPEDNTDQDIRYNCMKTLIKLEDLDLQISSLKDNIDEENRDVCTTTSIKLDGLESRVISPENNTDQGNLNSYMTTSSELEDSDSRIISAEDNTDQDSKENIDTDIDIHGIWQCMKRINSNLDYLAQKFNVEQSDGVQGQAQKPSSSTLDDFDFSSLFPLNEMGDVVSLESKLMDEKSNFYKSFVSFITPKVHNRHAFNAKSFVRTILRTLFTYSLASNYSWSGLRGNFKISNLKIMKIIFDISKAKYKNVTKQCVDSFIKEWIRYAKQRHKQLIKMNE
ncbi:hypothetical protein QTP88_019000 [Uroleucon formosanum]